MKAKVFSIAAGVLFAGLSVVHADESDFAKGEFPPLMRQEIPVSRNALPEETGGGRIMKAYRECAAPTDNRFVCPVIVTTPHK